MEHPSHTLKGAPGVRPDPGPADTVSLGGGEDGRRAGIDRSRSKGKHLAKMAKEGVPKTVERNAES
jgi:hypothetical protein